MIAAVSGAQPTRTRGLDNRRPPTDSEAALAAPRAPTPRLAEPPPFEAIQSDTRFKLFRTFARLRLVNTPLWAAVMLWFGLTQPPLWRQVLLLAMAGVAFVITVADYATFNRRSPQALAEVPRPKFAVAPALGMLVVLFVTGGIESPMVPMIPIMAFSTTFFASERAGRLVVFGILVPGVVLLAGVTVFALVPGLNPPIFGGGVRAGHPDVLVWTTAALTIVAVLAIHGMARHLRTSADETLRQAAAERDRALELHHEQSRALTTLSGELAHELKNPLASVKGLAALMAMDATGEGAEQLAVLRREVDRMQGVLEEFLNFSRPLVPLAEEEVDLGALVREVATLHEGLAATRMVRLGVAVEGEPRAECDARKVIQILMNLVQNAIEASPRGGTVTLMARVEGEEVRISIRDEGPGPAAGIRSRIFDPGVTDKPTGSGLGLTIARALARQHGGELTLEPTEGGGSAALLTLPVERPSRIGRRSSPSFIGPDETPSAGAGP